ncbi:MULTISPECIES: helix-turn-helix domain-containing protein [Bradyrhizobium]|uniref:helix-turn-helix domain-containing protein n=1 Tax=Bradyrhizobium elkanii TaxID=29448 RepID=UPI000485019D|nr:helix-turn-helix domain-containing protein [Bradyrhizobium elkanii]
MTLASAEFLNSPELDIDAWREALLQQWGRYTPVAREFGPFTGRARARKPFGFVGVDLSCNNADRVVRTQRDTRLDGADYYFALFQIAGASTIVQNDHEAQLVVGDVALVDSSRPGAYIAESGYTQWFSLQLPRRSLVSHLGFNPEGALIGRDRAVIGRALFDLVRNADRADTSTFHSSHLQLAIYDLVGALLAPSGPAELSLHADKLFKRVCDLIRDGYINPDFGPREVATGAGISLRYLQKLFAARNSTCSEFIYSLRLDHAARLLHRRKLMRTEQPISEIAYVSGFRDYTNFARKFRLRFGHSPSSHKRDLA